MSSVFLRTVRVLNTVLDRLFEREIKETEVVCVLSLLLLGKNGVWHTAPEYRPPERPSSGLNTQVYPPAIARTHKEWILLNQKNLGVTMRGLPSDFVLCKLREFFFKPF